MSLLKNCTHVTIYSTIQDKVMTYMNGNIYEDDRFPDGTYVRTSAVIHIDSDKVTTSSGSVYRIEEPIKYVTY